MKYFKSLLLLFFSLALLSCQNLPKDLPDFDELLRASTGQDGRACIRTDRINGYGILDSKVISVDTLGRDYFLVTTIQQCHSLEVSFAAAFKGSFAEFCAVRDKIVTQDEFCQVKSIFRFDNREEAFAAFEKADEERNKLIEEFRKTQE